VSRGGHAYNQLLIAPGTQVPALLTTVMTDLFVLPGEIRAGETAAGSGCYVVIDAETELTLSSRYGARLLAWPTAPCDGSTASLGVICTEFEPLFGLLLCEASWLIANFGLLSSVRA
jgi:hypothetical protein